MHYGTKETRIQTNIKYKIEYATKMKYSRNTL